MSNFFANIFGYVLNGIYFLVKNYGLAIIIFSVLVKILMIPISVEQQKTLKKNEKIQKEMKILQVKHKGNQEKLNQEMMELYKREKINPFGGCLNVILQMVLIISMFMLVKSPITYMTKVDTSAINAQIDEIKKQDGENSISAGYPEMSIIKYLQKNNLSENEMYINMDFFGLDLSKVPQENLNDYKVYIIPVLYVISSVISLKISTKTVSGQKEKIEEKEGTIAKKEDLKQMDQEEMTAQMGKSMSLMMPILSVSIAFVAPLGLALYWFVNNIIMIIERLVLNKVFSKEDEING